jgi:DNA-binding transcriptional ArsR family regulator
MNDGKTVVFERAAAMFAVLSTPIRLRIISELCQGERNVGQLLGSIDVAQPNMSQHLNMMYRAGVLGRRRQGAQMFYRIADESAAMVCRAVCTQKAIEAAVD